MKKVVIVSTRYANEDTQPTIRGVFSDMPKAKAWIKVDKKRIKKQGLTPYNSDYIIQSFIIDSKV